MEHFTNEISFIESFAITYTERRFLPNMQVLFYNGFWLFLFIIPLFFSYFKDGLRIPSIAGISLSVFFLTLKNGLWTVAERRHFLLPICLFVIGVLFFSSLFFSTANIHPKKKHKISHSVLFLTMLNLFAIFAVTLLVEMGIFLADWQYVHANSNLFQPFRKDTPIVTTAGSIHAYDNIETISLNSDNYNFVLTEDPHCEQVEVSFFSQIGRISVSVEKKQLIISQKQTHNLYNLFFSKNPDRTKNTIYIKIPKNTALQNLSLTLHNGNGTIKNMSINNLVVTQENGTISGTKLYIKDGSLSIQNGSLNFTQFTAQSLQATSENGAITLDGQLYDNGTFHIGNGDFTLHLAAPKDYYNLQFNRGIGSISINGINYEDVPLTSKNDHTIFLENKKGNCSLSFND